MKFRNTPKNPSGAPEFTVISLGCPKNLVDTETMVARLMEYGYTFRSQTNSCDFVLLNTCGFLASAREEAREFLSELLDRKAEGAIRYIFVAGCAVNFENRHIAEEFPEIDAWISVYDEPQIAEIIAGFLPIPEEQPETQQEPNIAIPQFYFRDANQMQLDHSKRQLLTPKHVAFLKIADGCSRFCSFCAIPKIRGAFVSQPKESVLEEARKLIDDGAKELILIAQETTFWGCDLYGKPQLASLLNALCELPGEFRLRLLYTYPLHFEEELIAVLAEQSRKDGPGKILPYIDLPLQHANDVMLKRMNRQVTRSSMEELLGTLRERIENLVLRTSLIAGFPGETEEMFEELLEFCRKWKFERGGAFAFSAEEGTLAAKMDEQLPPELIASRYRRLVETLSGITQDWERTRIGSRCEVILDQPCFSEEGHRVKGVYYGRSFAEAPEIDPSVIVNGEKNLRPGQVVQCEIVQIHDSNPIAVVVK